LPLPDEEAGRWHRARFRLFGCQPGGCGLLRSTYHAGDTTQRRRTSGTPNFAFPAEAASTKSVPPLAASGGREAILDSVPSPRPRTSSFTNVKETTMTISLEQQVEELRA